MEWTVRTVLVALVGLLATVGAPVIKLNSNLTKLTVLLDTLKNDMQEQRKSPPALGAQRRAGWQD